MYNIHQNDTLLDENHKLIKLAENVLEKRSQIFNNSDSIEILKMSKIDKIKDYFKNYSEQLNQVSCDIVMFQVSLIVNGTKCFEAFSFDNDGKRVLENTIKQNFFSIQKALFHKVIIKPFTKQHVINQVVYNIRKNYLTARLIAGKDFTRQKLEEFIYIQQYKVFEQSSDDGCTKYIRGLSSFDGRILYINQLYIFDYCQVYVEPKQELNKMQDFQCRSKYYKLIWSIEFYLIQNLSRWSTDSHVLSISPERNMNLRIQDNQMIGAGTFYLTKAHKNFIPYLQNPFKISPPFR